jgi:antitoxin (DNA-binding transcriptional repressor) of toxin-antitoxin stability system
MAFWSALVGLGMVVVAIYAGRFIWAYIGIALAILVPIGAMQYHNWWYGRETRQRKPQARSSAVAYNLAMSTQLEIVDANSRLPELLQRARAGEEIVLAEGGTPVAKIVPVAVPSDSRDQVQGSWCGKAWIADDFNAPLPEDELREWEK